MQAEVRLITDNFAQPHESHCPVPVIKQAIVQDYSLRRARVSRPEEGSSGHLGGVASWGVRKTPMRVRKKPLSPRIRKPVVKTCSEINLRDSIAVSTSGTPIRNDYGSGRHLTPEPPFPPFAVGFRVQFNAWPLGRRVLIVMATEFQGVEAVSVKVTPNLSKEGALVDTQQCHVRLELELLSSQTRWGSCRRLDSGFFDEVS